MGKSLKVKLATGALGLVLLVCIAIVVAVSFLVNQQNFEAVQRNLDKAKTVCEIELKERQKNLTDEINRMVVENSLGATIKFLFEFSEDTLSMTESTYFKAAGIVMNKATAINLRSIGVYDINGNLQVFTARKTEDSFKFGFFKAPQAHINTIKRGEAIDESAWKTSEQTSDMKLPLKLESTPSAETIAYVTNKDGILCIEAIVPVFSTDYDDEGEPFSKQFGVVRATKDLDSAFIERLHLLTGMSINIFSGQHLYLGQLKNFSKMDPDVLASANQTKSNSMNEILINKTTYFFETLPTSSLKGVSGSIAILQSDEIAKSNTFQMIKILTLVCLICLILIIPVVILFSKSIISPILNIVERMHDISEGEGDLRGRIKITAKDEIGQLAQNFNTFVEKIQEMVRQVKENLDHLNLSSSSLSDISTSLASSAGQSSEKANSVAVASEEMSSNMNSMAATMGQAAASISMVSDNTQQMSDSIQDVKKNTINANHISDQAVSQAKKASNQVEELGVSAGEIEKVIESITEISEQVNLLSLNATIEAARAGEAGRGFAVVANEIKMLANQTAKASDEIKIKVLDIRNSTDATVLEIEAITKVNNQINNIVQLTSTKIEEQAAATDDIAQNVSQASQGISEVNENVSQSSLVSTEIAKEISDVTHTAGEISDSSTQVKSRATQLSELSEKLKNIVDQFKV